MHLRVPTFANIIAELARPGEIQFVANACEFGLNRQWRRSWPYSRGLFIDDPQQLLIVFAREAVITARPRSQAALKVG